MASSVARKAKVFSEGVSGVIAEVQVCQVVCKISGCCFHTVARLAQHLEQI